MTQATARCEPARVRDVHAHYYPPALKALGEPTPMNSWSLDQHIESMEAAGVARSVLSLPPPEWWRRETEVARWPVSPTNTQRNCAPTIQVDSASLRDIQPDDVDGALKEIEYGLDVLKGHGVGLFTSYGNRWLGDPQFDPVFAELERRKAVVYVHPTSPVCCTRLIPDFPTPHRVRHRHYARHCELCVSGSRRRFLRTSR